jgi:hypothetical protein
MVSGLTYSEPKTAAGLRAKLPLELTVSYRFLWAYRINKAMVT